MPQCGLSASIALGAVVAVNAVTLTLTAATGGMTSSANSTVENWMEGAGAGSSAAFESLIDDF